jgi:hypothetical protein
MLAIVLFIKSVAKKYSGSIVAFSANPGSEFIGELCVLGSLFSFASDTKTNVQTYVAFDEIKSWLQRKKEGMS